MAMPALELALVMARKQAEQCAAVDRSPEAACVDYTRLIVCMPLGKDARVTRTRDGARTRAVWPTAPVTATEQAGFSGGFASGESRFTWPPWRPWRQLEGS